MNETRIEVTVMAVLDIVTVGDPVLEKRAEEVTRLLSEL